jgi:hypothetical protein
MSELESCPALNLFINAVKAGSDIGALEADLPKAKEELDKLSPEKRKEVLGIVGHIKGLGDAAEQALEGKEVIPAVQGGKSRRHRSKSRGKKKKSKSPKRKSSHRKRH